MERAKQKRGEGMWAREQKRDSVLSCSNVDIYILWATYYLTTPNISPLNGENLSHIWDRTEHLEFP